LSGHSSAELHELQRSFVKTMLLKYSDAANKTSKSAKSIVAYATSAFTYHCSQAFREPLFDDPLCKTVLLSDSDAIVDQALQATKVADAEALGKWYMDEAADYWAAARTFDAIAMKFRGADFSTKLSAMRSCLSAFEHVEIGSQEGAGNIKAQHMWRMFRLSPDQEEKNHTVDQLVGWVSDEKRPNPAYLAGVVGLVVMGIFPSKYSMNRNQQQIVGGAASFFAASRGLAKPCDDLTQAGFPRQKILINGAMQGFCFFTICSLHPQWAQETSYFNGIAGEELLKVMAMYADSAAAQRLHLRMMASSQFDMVHACGGGFPAFFLKFVDLAKANAQRMVWESMDVQIEALNDAHPYSAGLVWTLLDMLEVGAAERVANVWNVSWANVDSWIQNSPANSALAWAYTDEGGTVKAAQPEALAVRLIARMLL
jgi:hypothetical protein